MNMMENLPALQVVGYTAAAGAAIAYGVVEALKGFLKGWVQKKRKETPWWWSGLIRLLAMGIGAGAGFFVHNNPWGLIIGAGGGVFSAAIVAIFKARLRKLEGAESKPAAKKRASK